MHFIAKPRRPSRRRRALTLSVRLLLRLSLVGLLLLFILLILLTSLFRHPPPPTLPTSLPESNQAPCHCISSDSCTTSVPVGSYRPPRGGTLEERRRRKYLRSLAAHVWDAYAEHAMGYDEYLPNERRGEDTLGGFAETVIQSVGALYMFELITRYQDARRYIADELQFGRSNTPVSVHAVTARIIGPLISTYQLTGDSLFLHKAEQLALVLSPAWDTLSGVPYPTCSLNGTRATCWGEHTTQDAAAGGVVELRALGYHSVLPEVRQLRCRAERAVQGVLEGGPELFREAVSDYLLSRQASADVNGTEFDRFPDLPMGSTSAAEKAARRGWFAARKWRSRDVYYGWLVHAWHGAVGLLGGVHVEGGATFGRDARGLWEGAVKGWRQGGGCEKGLGWVAAMGMDVLLRRGIGEQANGVLALRTLQQDDDDNDDHHPQLAVVHGDMCYLAAALATAAQTRRGRARELWVDGADAVLGSCETLATRADVGGEWMRWNGKVWVVKGGWTQDVARMEARWWLWRETRKETWRRYAWREIVQTVRKCGVQQGRNGIVGLHDVAGVSKTDGRMQPGIVGGWLRMAWMMWVPPEQWLPANWIWSTTGAPLLVTKGLAVQGGISTCDAGVPHGVR